jgi:hypothetical protein
MGKEDAHHRGACCGACDYAALVAATPDLEPPNLRPLLTPRAGVALRVQHRWTQEERRVDFHQPRVTVGRIQGNDLVLPSAAVSKKTCVFFFVGDQLWVEDLKSTCGTYINGRNIHAPTPLRQGDRVFVGDYILAPEESEPGRGRIALLADGVSAEAGPRVESAEKPAAPSPLLKKIPWRTLRS